MVSRASLCHFLVPFWCRKYRRRYTRADFSPPSPFRSTFERFQQLTGISHRGSVGSSTFTRVFPTIRWQVNQTRVYCSRYRKVSSSKIKSTQLGFDLEFYGTGERSHCFILIFISLLILSNYVRMYILYVRMYCTYVRQMTSQVRLGQIRSTIIHEL